MNPSPATALDIGFRIPTRRLRLDRPIVLEFDAVLTDFGYAFQKGPVGNAATG
jgi:hypothetical protein